MARLIVPVVPALIVAAGLLAEHARPLFAGLRTCAALLVGLTLEIVGWRSVANARQVSSDRSALVAAARPVLGPLRRVAALDVGWVGAATDAEVVDLAGLTDPRIASLPGGHTSKRVDAMMLLSRDPDAIVLYAPFGLGERDLSGWKDLSYGRAVEQRLVDDPVLARHFGDASWLPLGGARGSGYLVLRALRANEP
jgi:hypothetical protein